MLDFDLSLHFVALFLFTKGRGSQAGNILTFFLSKFAIIVAMCLFGWVLHTLVCENAGALQVDYILLHLQYPLSSLVTAPQHSGLCLITARTSLILREEDSKLSLVIPLALHFQRGECQPVVTNTTCYYPTMFCSFAMYLGFHVRCWNLLLRCLTQHGGSLSSSLNAPCYRISHTSLL